MLQCVFLLLLSAKKLRNKHNKRDNLVVVQFETRIRNLCACASRLWCGLTADHFYMLKEDFVIVECEEDSERGYCTVTARLDERQFRASNDRAFLRLDT